MKFLNGNLFLLFFLLVTYVNADQNCSSTYLIRMNAKLLSLEEKLNDVTLYKYTYSNDLKNIEQNFKDKVSYIEHSYQTDTTLFKEQYKHAKESMEDRKTLLTITATMVLFFVVSVFAFYGIRIYDVHNSYKNKEKDYKETMDEVKESIERKFEIAIEQKQEKHQGALDEIQKVASLQVTATIKEADTNVRKYQDEVNKLLTQLQEIGNGDHVTEHENDDPFKG